MRKRIFAALLAAAFVGLAALPGAADPKFEEFIQSLWPRAKAAGISRPVFDQAFAALINDLDTRGLLSSTLVMVTTEFGRTPKINGTGGRDHWPKVFSIVLAGGGLKRGTVYGSTDATGSEPENNPLGVEDFACTLYTQLGIDPDKALLAPGNRPVRIVYGGKPAKDLLA